MEFIESSIFKHDVFISYSTKDSEIANKICYVFEQNNLKCWIAPRNITSGRNYIDEIADAIKSTKIVILVFSQYSQESKYVNNEINLAFSYNKPIFSFNIDNSLPKEDMEYYLKVTQWLPAYPNPEDFLETLIIESLNLIKEADPVKYIREKFNEATPTENVKSFKYLDELIHSGVKEIVLDEDIVLDDEEESEYLDGIKLDVDNLVIDGNGFAVYAKGKTRIFYCSGKNITIKNITLKHGFIKDEGGAIYNDDGELTITESTLSENTALDGGAIYNDGKMNIMKSTFSQNRADQAGGAIRNDDDMRIQDVSFEDNISKSSEDIHNNWRLVIDGKFSSNQAEPIASKGIIIASKDFKEKMDNSGKIIKLKTLDENQKDFTYLNNLINSGIDEIKLENDIFLNIENNEDEIFETGIKIDRDGLVIDGNGHTIDAQFFTRIFECSGKNITIKNITLKHGYSIDAGAIYNEGILSLTDSNLLDNMAKDDAGAIANIGGELTITKTTFVENTAEDGGAIWNMGNLKLNDCQFQENTAKEAGAILIEEGDVDITDCQFQENTAKKASGAIFNLGKLSVTETLFNKNTAKKEGGVIKNTLVSFLRVNDCNFKSNNAVYAACIYNESDDVKIINSIFSNNNSADNLILNKNNMNILGCTFESNEKVDCIISSAKESRLTISGGKIKDNHVKKSTIHTEAIECSISNTNFKNNIILSSNSQCGADIVNEVQLSIQSPKISDDNAILNKGHIDVRRLPHNEAERIIYNVEGASVDEFIPPSEDKFDFTHLTNIIQNGDYENVIVLKEDISLENYELDFHEGGIDLDKDNLTIDGDNHFIDGKHKTRIFNITGKNITLKNIIFKNGLVMNLYDEHTGGGAIRIAKNSNLKLINCKFIHNASQDDGGAILNNGILQSENNKFINNHAEYNAGAIQNNSILSTTSDVFENNASKTAGAIYNNHKLTIKKQITLKNNISNLKEDIYNANHIMTEGFDLDVEKTIFNTHNINIDENANEWQTFQYLKSKLMDSHPVLDENIKIEFNDIDDGVILIDNLEFDGKDHIIDLNHMNINFKIRGNATIKNLTLKNGLIGKDSLFEIEGSLRLENVKFLNNKINNDCHLLNNRGTVEVIDSHFYNNKSKNNSLINNNNNLKITNTDFINNHSNSEGSIINNIKDNKGKVLIENSLFQYNSTTKYGGTIINNRYSVFEISNSKFIKNTAKIIAGAIINFGKLSVTETLFKGNSTMESVGGAIVNADDGVIADCHFQENTAKENGGAISNIGKLTITETIFDENSTQEVSGGAIYIQEGDVELTNCQFQNNTANKNGGAIINFGKLSITETLFRGNSTQEDNGGAINNQKSGIINASNIEFNQNTANENGGAIYTILDENLNLKDCTFKDNKPDDVY